MFYLLRKLFMGSQGSEEGGVTGLLKDGTFMMWAAVGTAIVVAIVFVVLATGGVAEVLWMWQLRDQLQNAHTPGFLRFLIIWREFKPIIALVIVMGGIALWIYFWAGGWSKRKPNPIIVATAPQSSLGKAAADEVEYDLDVPQYEDQVQLGQAEQPRLEG